MIIDQMEKKILTKKVKKKNHGEKNPTNALTHSFNGKKNPKSITIGQKQILKILNVNKLNMTISKHK